MKINNKSGFVKIIIIIVIALIVLGYFGFNLEDIIKSHGVQRNLSYVWNFLVYVWDHFLAGPVIFIWDKFIVGILWKFFMAGLNRM